MRGDLVPGTGLAGFCFGFRCSLERRWVCTEGQGVLTLTVIAGRMEEMVFLV